MMKLITDAFLKAKTPQEMQKFLYGILTEAEIETIYKRLQIIEKLKAGVPQHTIAKELSVGVSTVTRGNSFLKKGYFQNV